jgi:glycosyltransferase involved in cell wall biosynthesis
MARIVLDARNVTARPGGVARYALALLRSLAALDTGHELIAIRHESGRGVALDAPGVREVYSTAANDDVRHHVLGARALAEVLRTVGAVDVYHSLFHVPPLSAAGVVVTLHDLVWLDHPLESQPTWARAQAIRGFARVALPHALRRADHVISVSEPTRSRASRWLRGTPTTVIGHGVDAAFFATPRTPARQGAPTVVTIGNAKPYKNLELLLKALARSSDLRDVRLTVIGAATALRDRARALGVEARVRFAGELGDAALREALASADAFVFPSRVEGFGLPVLEAMAMGVPTVVADVEPMRSIAGDAALTFAPTDASALGRTLWRVLADEELAKELSERGRGRASSFRWEDTAQRTLAVYEAVAQSRR